MQRLAQDISARKVEVNRVDLLITLKKNRTVHVSEYNAAMAGYKELLIEKINEAFLKARTVLMKEGSELVEKVNAFTDEDISKQNDHFQVVKGVAVEMIVPRSHEKEYDAAIDMVDWDVREVLELSNSEFVCFVRDEWDWQANFKIVNASYTGG